MFEILFIVALTLFPLVEISALKKQNLNSLLDTILLVSEILEIKASLTQRSEGTVVEAKINEKSNKPSIYLVIDFGNDIGQKKTSAQLIKNYLPEELIGKQVAAVTNFPPKQIGKMISEVLVLGFPDDNNDPILVMPTTNISNGGKLF